MTADILNTNNHPAAVNRRRRAERVVNLGLGFNTVLAPAKLFGGILGHSQALLADGVNSASDVVYLAVVKVFVRLSGAPADREHPYGHHQYESIAALVVGAFVITTALAIFWDSANTAFDLLVGTTIARPVRTFAFWVACATVLTKLFLMLHAGAAGRATRNIALCALARDHRNDIFSALGAAAGILLSLLGFPWFDPLAGAVVAVVVAKTGFDILRESSASLMDAVPGEELTTEVKRILGLVEGIDTIEEIHAHRFGPYLVVNITVGVDGNLSVAEGDRIAEAVERRLLDEIEMLRKVYVHYHPSRYAG